MSLSDAINDYLNLYLAVELRRDEGTIKYHYLVLRQFDRLHPNADVKDITIHECQNFVRKVSLERKPSNRVYNQYISRLKSFFEYCILEEWIDKNPAMRIKTLKEEKRLVMALTKQELYEIINCRLPYKTAKRDLWARDRCLMMFAASTGLRPKEIAGANWGDINFESQSFLVRAEVAKGKKERRVYLINETASLLYHQFKKVNPKSEDPVFLSRDHERFVPDGINRIFVKIIKYLGITRFDSPRVYLLRKSYITYLIKDGVNIESVSTLAGHSNPAITWKYYKEANTFNEIKQEVEDKFFMNHSPRSSELIDFQKHLKKRGGYVTKRDNTPL